MIWGDLLYDKFWDGQKPMTYTITFKNDGTLVYSWNYIHSLQQKREILTSKILGSYLKINLN